MARSLKLRVEFWTIMIIILDNERLFMLVVCLIIATVAESVDCRGVKNC